MYGLSKDIEQDKCRHRRRNISVFTPLVAIVVASLAPVPAIIVVFSTAGAMFLISMLAGLLFNIDPVLTVL